MKRIFPIFFLLGFLLFTCQSASMQSPPTESEALVRLKRAMIGSFDSHEQAGADSSYFNISLHMVPIWTKRSGEHWLYVEQALATRQEAPYRQRVYHLETEGGDTLSSAVYTLPDPEGMIGAWQTPHRFDSLNPDDLAARVGCTVYLVPQKDGSFEGSTHKQDCESNLRGASYAVSSVRIAENEIVSWDQGFDSLDQQVWGAEKGGYRFVKIKE